MNPLSRYPDMLKQMQPNWEGPDQRKEQTATTPMSSLSLNPVTRMPQPGSRGPGQRVEETGTNLTSCVTLNPGITLPQAHQWKLLDQSWQSEETETISSRIIMQLQAHTDYLDPRTRMKDKVFSLGFKQIQH